MKLIARKPLRYGGRDYLPGDEVEVTDRDGRTLIAIGKIAHSLEADDVSATTRVPVTPRKPKAPRKKGNGYQTRRLKTED